MPIFEYKCKKCGEVFELLVRSGEKPKCPACGGSRLEKLISTFNASAEGSSKRRGGCASGDDCCGGSHSGGHCCHSGGCCCGGRG